MKHAWWTMRSSRPRRGQTPLRQHTVDLHAHTTASDGLVSPSQLVDMARQQGLRVLAVTDHDTTNGVDEALHAATAALTIVPGVEINTNVDGRETHVLGYYIEHHDPSLQRFLSEQRNGRDVRAERMIERLGDHNIHLDLMAIRTQAAGAALGRPHVARALVAAGHARSVQDAFDQWLGIGRPAYAARPNFTPEEAVAVIRKAGGVAVLAHPASMLELETRVSRLVDVGLAGIECYYPGYSTSVTAALVAVARRYGLVPTGGTDFHGTDMKHGRALGAVFVPVETPDHLKRRCVPGDVSKTVVPKDRVVVSPGRSRDVDATARTSTE